MIRIYYNSSEPGERPWSVDRGTQETEQMVDFICLGGRHEWVSVVDEKNKNRNAPTGWLQCVEKDIEIQLCIVEEGDNRTAIIL